MPRRPAPEKIALIERDGGAVPPGRRRRPRSTPRRRAWPTRRRPLPRPVHLCRAGDRLARQQQHRRVDLRADGAGAVPGADLDRRRCGHGRYQRDDRPLRALSRGTPPGSRSSTRSTRRSSPAGATATRPSPAPGRASRASAGRASSPVSSRRGRPHDRRTGCCLDRHGARRRGVLGRLVGPSTGTNLWGALRIARELRRRGGIGQHRHAAVRQRRPLRQHVYDDAWLAEQGIDITPYDTVLQRLLT